ncbi:type II restriction endonuclease [Devosia sp.]|uniref:type II restriction endonuclease n=1 Tax=Devosia sp. TaxID=1871048 RepID=UPI003BA9589C
MSQQSEFAFEQSGPDADLLVALIGKADLVFVKKLSNNDRDWARFANKHQAGVYIPHRERDSGFFPELAEKPLRDPDGHTIRETFFRTFWPQVNEVRETRLVHYTSKGQETHLTRLPQENFSDLLPASFIVIGRITGKTGHEYECLTIDSGSDEAELLAESFSLDPEFLVQVFDPAAVRGAERDKVFDFADQVIAAWLDGKIASFASGHAAMPTTLQLALKAQGAWLEKTGQPNMDPFALHNPGDVLREISRSIEWELFREYQRRERSVELVRIVFGDTPNNLSPSEIIRALVDEFPRVDALMLSASQQRKSRAGYSYEHHIEAMLLGGNIPFEKQVVIEAKKRPDFILPSLTFLSSKSDSAATGLILSAKTTLRERWKQVEREMGGKRRLFLSTVDENIAGNAIEDMASLGVHLVIPESLKKSKLAEYEGHCNVLGFREFCESQIKPNLVFWRT